MTSTSGYSLRPIGVVRSQLTAREEAPRQGSEGALEAWVEIDPAFADALSRTLYVALRKRKAGDIIVIDALG
jgi:tRNA (Thr-GGU) A37 N-methylase